MLGLLRLLTNRKVMRDAPLTADEAWSADHAFRALPEVVFMHEPGGTESQMATWSDSPSFASHRWTDVWMAALGFCAGARLVSFDHDFRTFPSLSFYHLI